MSDNNPEHNPEFLEQVLSKAGVQIGGYIGTIIDWNFDEVNSAMVAVVMEGGEVPTQPWNDECGNVDWKKIPLAHCHRK